MTLPSALRLFGGVAGLVVLGFASPALADCVTVGSVTTCNGYVPEGINFGTVSGRTVNVQPGATLGSGLSTDALRITNSSGVSAVSITNSGTINGSITMLSVGTGLDSLTNNGLITFTSPSSVVATSGISMAGATFIQSASGTLAFRFDSASFSDTLLANRATLNGTSAPWCSRDCTKRPRATAASSRPSAAPQAPSPACSPRRPSSPRRWSMSAVAPTSP